MRFRVAVAFESVGDRGTTWEPKERTLARTVLSTRAIFGVGENRNMTRSLLACVVAIQGLAGCANVQHRSCRCCQAGWSQDASKSFAELSGIESSASKPTVKPR